MKTHPRPWRVAYDRLFDEWHKKSSPHIRDAHGNHVLQMPQHVGHPGLYDAQADHTAHLIVNGVNATTNLPASLLTNSNFSTLLQTLGQYALLDDKIGMEQTGWVLGRLMATHLNDIQQRPLPNYEQHARDLTDA